MCKIIKNYLVFTVPAECMTNSEEILAGTLCIIRYINLFVINTKISFLWKAHTQ